MARIDNARVNANNTIEKNEPTGSWVRQVVRALEEQLKENQQELNMREQKKATHAKRTRGIVHDNDKSKGTSHVHGSCTTMNRNCSACGKDGFGSQQRRVA